MINLKERRCNKMGRPGAGGGGGRSVSSGGHSSSRSSGGHSVGSSSSRPRPSSSSRSNSSFNTGVRTGSSFRPLAMRRLGYRTSPYRGYSGYRGSSSSGGNSGDKYIAITVVAIVIALLIIGLMAILVKNAMSQPMSTMNRERLETNIAYNNDCVIDELGWVDNLDRTSKDMREFYQDTGVQPMFYLKAYDSGLIGNNDKTLYAEDWYENHVDNESTFLVMYFAEPDSDNDMGYLAYVCGKQAGSVMDVEAVNIFWSYLDSNWLSDKSMDKVISDSFV